ncbi:Asp-tRNA(Asn)/Glu-tRNA(Gln) amidotransferase subunit GatA [Candidatus Uhrbacteria bacterium]|nr:Asp-tRNA(Asn)/Glu-tRNA(Gln) amidotransferase subunit GatA [Candidatus Uhrbacteria bacterium]
MGLSELTVERISRGLKAGEFGSEETVREFLRLAEIRSAKTGSFVEIYGQSALEEARASDERRRQGKALSDLDGVPVALKDNLLLAGKRAEAASAILRGYVSAYDATAVRRLREAGAVFLGRTNMDEFAMGSSTETSIHGPTRNPWDTERVPGGSSGGSAAAVAEGSVPAALGSDTGGSIRQPAAMCGAVGLKPTYGRVSRYGLIAMASSLDQIGPLTRTVGDAAIILKAIEGWDGADSNSVRLKPEWAVPERWTDGLKGVRIGLPKEYFSSELDPDIRGLVMAAAAKMEGMGAELTEIDLPHAKYALSVYYVLMPAEVSANLARFDGVRYGNRAEADDLVGTYRRTRGQGFGVEVRRRIMVGNYVLSSGYYGDYYRKAQQVRRLIVGDFRLAFGKCDLILSPTAPSVAWKLGGKADSMSMYLADIFTVSANVAGLPGISLPCGLSNGLPVGLQILGPHFSDGNVLAAAHAYEQARGPFGFPPPLEG